MLGAARLCLNSGKTPAQLTDMVTSPGGTTIEGIKALRAGKIEETLATAVNAATQRSKDLGGKNSQLLTCGVSPAHRKSYHQQKKENAEFFVLQTEVYSYAR